MHDKQQGQYIIIVKNGHEVQNLPYGGCNHSKFLLLSLETFSH
jgi:hypothetical protein